MGGSVVTSCSLHVLLSTCGVCSGLCAHSRGQQKQTNFYLMQRTREIVFYTPSGKKTLSAWNASYNCSARMELKLRPTCPDGLPVSGYLAFCRKVLLRREKFERRRKFHKYTYLVYIYRTYTRLLRINTRVHIHIKNHSLSSHIYLYCRC